MIEDVHTAIQVYAGIVIFTLIVLVVCLWYMARK